MPENRRWSSRFARLVALSCAVATTLCSCGDHDRPKPVTPPTTGSVVGRVTDIDTGRPVPRAGVALVGPENLRAAADIALTSASGEYRFDQISPGRYSLFVYQDSMVIFDRSSLSATVAAGETTVHDISLINTSLWANDHRLRGTVLDDQTGLPISGAYVGDAISGLFRGEDVLNPMLGTIVSSRWSMTDAQGRFSMDGTSVTDEYGEEVGLEPISVSASGYEPFTLVGQGQPILPPSIGPVLALPPGDSVLVVEIRMHRLAGNGIGSHGAGIVTGRVMFLGTPVPGINVALSLAWTDSPDTLRNKNVTVPVPDKVARTDQQGWFTIADVAPGRYSITAAYLPDDGYVDDWTYTPQVEERDAITVTPGETTIVGDLRVVKALQASFPADGSAITDSLPQLRWTEIPLPRSFELVGYSIWWSTEYVQDGQASDLANPWYQLRSDEVVPPGGHLRWTVAMYARSTASVSLPVLIGAFERHATFSVRKN